MILDVDTGIDDSIALLLALKSEDVRLLGITTVFGNVSVEQATENTLQVANLAGRSDVPVLMGADRPLLGEWDGPVVHIHGPNGVGGYSFPATDRKPGKERAADFIVRTVNEHPHELTLVFVGRLTNLAHALAKDPGIASRVKRLVLMGGALRAPGNVTPVSEANIWGDPEAARRVFESGMPITMVGLDVTMAVKLNESHIERVVREMAPGGERQAAFIEHILRFYFSAYERENGIYGSPAHDPLAVAVAIDPSFVETEEHDIRIETKGTVSYGATLSDMRGTPKRTNASVCVAVDTERFTEYLLRVLCR